MLEAWGLHESRPHLGGMQSYVGWVCVCVDVCGCVGGVSFVLVQGETCLLSHAMSPSSSSTQFVFAMSRGHAQVAAELKQVSELNKQLTRNLSAAEARRELQKESALRVAIKAYCHEPAGLQRFAEFLHRKVPDMFAADFVSLHIVDYFLGTDSDVLASWLDWESGPCTKRDVADAKRCVEDVQLLTWVEDQNASQGVAPPQRFVHRCRYALLRHTSGQILEALRPGGPRPGDKKRAPPGGPLPS